MTPMWYVKNGDVVSGPFTSAQLKRMADEGTLAPDTLVQRDDLNKWVKSAAVKGLHSRLIAEPVENITSHAASRNITAGSTTAPRPATVQDFLTNLEPVNKTTQVATRQEAMTFLAKLKSKLKEVPSAYRFIKQPGLPGALFTAQSLGYSILGGVAAGLAAIIAAIIVFYAFEILISFPASAVFGSRAGATIAGRPLGILVIIAALLVFFGPGMISGCVSSGLLSENPKRSRRIAGVFGFLSGLVTGLVMERVASYVYLGHDSWYQSWVFDLVHHDIPWAYGSWAYEPLHFLFYDDDPLPLLTRMLIGGLMGVIGSQWFYFEAKVCPACNIPLHLQAKELSVDGLSQFVAYLQRFHRHVDSDPNAFAGCLTRDGVRSPGTLSLETCPKCSTGILELDISPRIVYGKGSKKHTLRDKWPMFSTALSAEQASKVASCFPEDTAVADSGRKQQASEVIPADK